MAEREESLARSKVLGCSLKLSPAQTGEVLLYPRCLLCFSGLHQSLPAGERDVRGQEEDQVRQEVSGSPLQPGLGLFRESTGEGGAGKT